MFGMFGIALETQRRISMTGANGRERLGIAIGYLKSQ